MQLRPIGFLLAGLMLAGCTTRSGVDALSGVTPSAETTSSVVVPARPEVTVGFASAGDDIGTAIAAAPADDADRLSSPLVAVPQPTQALTVMAPQPEPERVALVVPERPAALRKSGPRQQIYRHRFRDAKPINFGKASPRAMAVHGVDVSRWQGEIDWPKLRSQGANFAFIKATDGGDHLDPMFRKNWRAAAAAGIRRGAYHFFYWCRTAGEQADWFIRNVPREAGALPPVIDVEWNGESRCRKRPSPERVREKMQVFMDKLERHYGQRPIIYTAPDFYRDNLRGAFPNHPFWLRAVAQHPSIVYPNRKWVFWQYSGSGLSHGVDGRIDLNVFHGGEDSWRAWLARHAG